MGIISDIFSGSGSGTGKGAAKKANVEIDKALETLIGGFFPTEDALNPFAAAGQGAVPGLQQLGQTGLRQIGSLGQFGQAGAGAIGDLAGAATPGGLNERLSEIFGGDTFRSLVDERTRAVQGQLGAGGLTRSGTALSEISAIPGELGLQIEQMLAGRSGAVAGMGQNALSELFGGGQNALAGLFGGGQGAALGLGNLRESSLAKQAALLAQKGENISSGVLTDQGIQTGAQQGALNLLGTGIGAIFSDPALKQNVEAISEIGDLTLVEWDWIPETAGTGIDELPTVGFLATEVQKLYPEFVTEQNGFLAVDYLHLIPAIRDKFSISERAA